MNLAAICLALLAGIAAAQTPKRLGSPAW